MPEQLRDEIGKRLKADIRKKVDQQVDLFVEQNGTVTMSSCPSALA